MNPTLAAPPFSQNALNILGQGEDYVNSDGAKCRNLRLGEKGLTLPGFESEVGYCLRFVRQVVQAALGKERWPITQGYSAAQALMQFKQFGWVLPKGSTSVPGDIYFWVGPEHGRFGHCAIRILGNQIAENSSYQVSGKDREARGTRSLAVLDKDYFIVRFPAL